MTEWSLKDAKEHFAQVVSAARTSPQRVTDENGTAAVVIGAEEYARLTGNAFHLPEKRRMSDGKEYSFVEHLMAMPDKEGFEIERAPFEPREIDL